MILRHTAVYAAFFALLFSVLDCTEPVFASVGEQTVEFQKDVSCVVRVVNEGSEDDAGPWRVEITPPGGQKATLSIPVQGGRIQIEELRAASFIAPGKQELFLSFSQHRNGIFNWAYVIDFSNGAASILFDSEWLLPSFGAGGAFIDQYRVDVDFLNISDKYMLFIEGERRDTYNWLYNAQTGRTTEFREIAESYITRISVIDPKANDGKSLSSLNAAVNVTGAASIDSLGEYVFHLRQRDGKWRLRGDTQFVPDQGIRSERTQGAVPVADMGLAITARGLEKIQRAPSARTATANEPKALDALLAGNSQNLVPRHATKLNTKNAAYTKALKEYLGRNGLPDAIPQIIQLFKVDMEGDGTDEVVIVARNVSGQDAAATMWETYKPQSAATDAPKAAKKGDYALVLARKIVGGKVRDIPLSQSIVLKSAVPGDAGLTLPFLHKTHPFADVNGDGIMEVIVGENSRNGLVYNAYTIKDGKAVSVPVAGAEASSADNVFLTAKEARKILQTWLDGHPLPPRPAVLTPEHQGHEYDGEPHYLFSLDDPERYWLNFLVNKRTGGLFYMMISDGEETTIEIEPLDAWYTKHF